MINRRVLGHDSTVWPTQLEDFARPDFKGKLGCASMLEATTIAQFAAIRVARGDAYAEDLLDRLCANGLRVYPSNLDTRESLVHENLAAVLANSSNVHVFHMEGNPVAEAWLDQEAGGSGTHVEAHTLAILKDCRHPEQARDFVDFLLGPETQSLLARLYGETPVNANAEHGWVKPLAAIRRADASLKQIAAALDSTRKLLQSRGFGAPVTSEPRRSCAADSMGWARSSSASSWWPSIVSAEWPSRVGPNSCSPLSRRPRWHLALWALRLCLRWP
jgi:ABC-type Fe3+ transport system substrate-binding protein